MKFLGLLLALAVTIGAVFALHRSDEALAPQTLAFEATRQDPPDYTRAVLLYEAALRADPANPYRWSDLAETFAAAGQVDSAQRCYRQALSLSGEVPQIWLRAANFHFNRNEYQDALPLAVRVLKTVPDYDSVLFDYFDQLLPTADLVFISIGTNRRVVRAYTKHLIDAGNLRAARTAFKFANASGFLDNQLAASYVEAMIKSDRAVQTQQDWVSYLGSKRGDYPEHNLIYNSGFESEPSTAPFDWRIAESPAFDTVVDKSVAHGGHSSIRIDFHGDSNAYYRNLVQLAVVPPGQYRLNAWVRTQGITTTEGPRIIVTDGQFSRTPILRTESLLGSSGWRPISQSFSVIQASVLSVAVVREPSLKFDHDIAGSFWLDDVTLERH